MKKLILAALTCTAALAGNAFAQDSSLKVNTLSEALPADVLNALSSATSVKKIYPVNGVEIFSGTILKADEIVFAPGSSIILSSIDAPFVIIAAKKWKFADANQWSRVGFAAKTGAAGSVGASGGDGADRPGETGRRGNDGEDGKAGGTGGAGGSQRLPKVYLVGGEFTSPSGQPIPGSLRLSLNLVGQAGGKGGTGGKGGNGGNAGNGKEGANKLFDCGEGGGPGGNGGAAGPGGAGGAGGAGSDGADLVYISKADGIEQLSYARIINMGGIGGVGGDPGKPGQPGKAGRGAPSNGFCKSTDAGNPGARPDPRDLGYGADGADGNKGSVTAVTVTSLAPIF